jgi:hypothetical protein
LMFLLFANDGPSFLKDHLTFVRVELPHIAFSFFG